MRICVAQLRPTAGDIEANVRKHHALLDLALSYDAQLVCFPELSLTGYETKLAGQLATHQDDPRLNTFQTLADSRSLCIAVGIPTVCGAGTRISMVVFQPGRSRVTYSKQQLHADELPYFVGGEQQLVIGVAEHSVAPAICYESLQDSHAQVAAELGADIYLASVAKSAAGVDKAFLHYPTVARRHAMTVVMANCVGPSDDFVAAGQSAIWSSSGELLTELDGEREGIALLDTVTGEVAAHYLAQSPWLQIPLADYEAHMASCEVDQASLLADIFSGVLARFRPASAAVIGCAGGNGFDRIDPRTTTRVVGMDINPEYLDATARRHSQDFRELVLCHADIAGNGLPLAPVDLSYAALVFEYVEIAAALRNLSSLCRDAGHLVAVLQLPSSQLAAITPTAIPSIMRLAPAMKLVDPAEFVEAARRVGFARVESTQVTSSMGKPFAIQIFQRRSAPEAYP